MLVLFFVLNFFTYFSSYILLNPLIGLCGARVCVVHGRCRGHVITLRGSDSGAAWFVPPNSVITIYLTQYYTNKKKLLKMPTVLLKGDSGSDSPLQLNPLYSLT